MRDELKWLYSDPDHPEAVRRSVSFEASPTWLGALLEDAPLYSRSAGCELLREQRALVVVDGIVSALTSFELPDCCRRTLDRHLSVAGSSRYAYCHELFRVLALTLPSSDVFRFPPRFTRLELELMFPRNLWEQTVSRWLQESSIGELDSETPQLLECIGTFFGQTEQHAERLRAAARRRGETGPAFIASFLNRHIYEDLGVTRIPGVEFSMAPSNYDAGFLFAAPDCTKTDARVAG